MILIITNRQDLTADFVVRRLTERGLAFARLNTDEFPTNAYGVVGFGGNRNGWGTIHWTNRPRPLRFEDVRAVWYRRPVAPVVDTAIATDGARKFATDECYEFLRGLWYNLDCYWMSHPEAIRRGEHKIVQLRTAVECGFSVPNTVVTNRHEEVAALAAECPHGIVAKALYLGYVEDAEQAAYIYTTRLGPEHLADHDAIRLAPAIYQEYIPKVADIRVTVVGHDVFATRIVAPELPDDIPDWRYAQLNLEHSHYELPAEERDRCRRLVQRLGLEFGAIDYALTSDARHVFLEINPNGQWAWIETATGCHISSAIADRLASATTF